MSLSSRGSIRRGSFQSNHSQKSRGGLTVTSNAKASSKNSYFSNRLGKKAVISIPEEQGTITPKSTETIKFVYSVAVTKAFKRDYNVTQFGPPSAATLRPRHSIEVSKLPEIYDDFKHITELLDSNQKYIDRLRHELETSGELSPRGGKLPHLHLKNFKGQRGRSRVSVSSPLTSVTPKLPPIT